MIAALFLQVGDNKTQKRPPPKNIRSKNVIENGNGIKPVAIGQLVQVKRTKQCSWYPVCFTSIHLKELGASS